MMHMTHSAQKMPRNAKPCTEILSRDGAGRALTARGYIRAGSKRLAQGVVRAGDNCGELALEDACLMMVSAQGRG